MLNKRATFEELLAHIRTAFKKLPKNFSLSYIDKEGDTISVTNQADLDIIYENKLPSLRLII